MSTKSQLIKSSTGTKSNSTGKWHIHNEVKPFIMGIETGDLLNDINSETLNSLISGIPTPWARAKLFWFAFHYLQHNDPNVKTSGLISIFKLLVDEWKGLMALIALYPDRIKFSDPIYMDNKSDKNLYNLVDGFGRMLFEDADLWSDQDALKVNSDEKPYIQLIYYRNQLVGATSPFSVFFTSVDYSKLNEVNDIKWYKKGRFEDPTKHLTEDQLQKVFSFVINIISNIDGFEEQLNSARSGKEALDLGGFKKAVRNWRDKIRERGELKENIPPAKYYNLINPFKILLASEQVVYILNDGTMSFIKPKDGQEGVGYNKLPDLQDLLLDSDTIIGWNGSTDDTQHLINSVVYYLPIPNPRKVELRNGQDPYLYFALPLSEAGINIFSSRMKTLLSSSGNRRLEAHINESGKLQVDLIVEIDRQPIKLNTKEYTIEWENGNKNVVLWPNFTSDNWNAYYMYSEFPINTADKKFIPFFKQTKPYKNSVTGFSKNGGILEYAPNDFILSTSSNKNKEQVGLDVETIVSYPLGKVNEDVPVYEIIKSNKAVAGLCVKIDDKKCGYLLIKDGDKGLDDKTNNDRSIDTATVGFDFGSNNSCAYYSLNSNNETYPISFTNRRIALVGVDIMHDSVAHDSELLFFQNAEGINGQIKSWLHEHHPLAPAHQDSDDALAGGVPVNEANIQIERMDRYILQTQAGKLHYNMKWLSDTMGKMKKTAYLKTIWLQICADLYGEPNNRCIPLKLRWSFPGAMSEVDKDQYTMIFSKSLPKITPILNENGKVMLPATDTPITESEAVCGYALSNEYGGLTESNLFLGIDVGGSTSDILVLAKTKENGKVFNKLIKQSSVRLAAGAFFDAIIKSNRFKEELYSFHENKGKAININVLGIGDLKDPQKKQVAPFYLNSVFDQLKEDGFDEFYQYMGIKSSFVFAIPAFVSGLLLYYAGMLVSHALDKENITGINKVDLFSFGKGGRLFHWLDTYPGEHKSTPYFESCFRKGFGENGNEIKLNPRRDIKRDNKSEVAMGLVSGNMDKLHVDKSLREKSDIFGEKNIKLYIDGEDKLFAEKDVLYAEYFADPGCFTFPDELTNFNAFLDIYLDFVGTQTNIVKNTTSIKMGAANLKEILTSYLMNDSEWKKANKYKNEGKDFDYRFPLIIAEGLCFLEKVIIPEVFKD
jgi:hypothetical protein